MKNDFKKDLEFSHDAEGLSLWREIYSKAFPGCKTKDNRADGELQRHGIDRTIVLESGKAIYCDEKIRRVDYGDILLEYISNDKHNTLGWVCKPLFCDYIAYAVLPIRKCYLFPVPQLQKAWIDNKDRWMGSFKLVKAPNKTYNTLSVCVPTSEVFRAIGQALRISFGEKHG